MSEIFAAFGINWKLLLIQAFNFGLLLLALWYFLYRPLLSMMEERQEKIEKGIKDAEQSEKRLAEIESEKDEIIAKATTKGGNIVSDAKSRGEEKAGEIVTDANARAEAIVNDANARAEEAKEQAMRESKDEIAKTAILAAEKILKEKS